LVGYFLRNLGGSPYYNINSLYYDDFGSKVANDVTYRGFVAANVNAPTPGTDVDHDKAKQAAQSVQSLFPNDGSTLYLAVVDSGVTVLGGTAAGFHSSDGNLLIGAIKYRGNGLHANDGPNGDPAAEGAIDVIAHEIVETSSNPWVQGSQAWIEDADSLPFGNGVGEAGDVCVPLGSTKAPRTWHSTAVNANGLANVRLGNKDFFLPGVWANRSMFWAENAPCRVALYTVEGPLGTGLYSSTLRASGPYAFRVEPAIPGNTYQWQYDHSDDDWQNYPATGSTVTLSTPPFHARFRVVVSVPPPDTTYITPPFPVDWPPSVSVVLDGPTQMGPQDVCWFHATAQDGMPPYTYSWQNGAQVETTDGSSYFAGGGGYISVVVTDAVNEQTSASTYVDVDEGNPGCH
jgi:hypothetical protein